MDDLQFRRKIFADPHNQDAEVILAQQKDKQKRIQAKTLQRFDEKIKSALDVAVPDDLVDKLILRQTMTTHRQAQRRSRIHLACAASVAIIASVLVNFFMLTHAHQNLGDYALAHAYYEEGNFDNNAEADISLANLNKKMASFKGAFSESIGKIISADYCRFDGIKSLHLVYQGITSPVSIYVVPNNDQLTFVSNFEDGKFQGETLAYKSSNIIIVADKNESLKWWEKQIYDKVVVSI
jgi:hypothetical protein|tara:strand:+ start:876 stop:1589 length:714 start_codon:yes stop_codon:yes gene_type:complete